jgi:hypothetical protein
LRHRFHTAVEGGKIGKIGWLVNSLTQVTREDKQKTSLRQKYLGFTFRDSKEGTGHCNFLHDSYSAARGPPLLVFTVTCTA